MEAHLDFHVFKGRYMMGRGDYCFTARQRDWSGTVNGTLDLEYFLLMAFSVFISVSFISNTSV